MIQTKDRQYLFKILLIGNSGVGKSCILLKYSSDEFTSSYYNTIGVDFKIMNSQINQQNVRLQIWDTAGQDRFRTITCSYYRGAHGIIIVFDMTDRDTFENVKAWMAEIEKYAQENVNRLLVGNKADLQTQIQISKQEAQQLADTYKMSFIECSAKSGFNIDQVFQTIATEIMKRSPQSNNTRPNYKLQNQNQQNRNDTCC